MIKKYIVYYALEDEYKLVASTSVVAEANYTNIIDNINSIIILGDVNPGATVVSKGNVVVLGTLKGSIYVGAGGNENTFVAALSMDPMQIRIADYIARNSDNPDKKDKKKLQKKKDKQDDQPMIAYVDAGNIYIEPITKEVLADINI